MNQQVNPVSRFPWRLFWLLFVATSLSAVASLPMAIELFARTLGELPPPSIPMPVLIVIGAVQNLALILLMVGLGLQLGRKVNLGPKITEAWLAGSLTRSTFWSALRSGVLTGLGVGAILLPLILLLSSRFPNLPFVSAARIALWKRFLICFYGGVFEEILARLFLLSLFAWLINRSWRKPDRLSSTAFWTANLLAAVLFGLGHLPSTSLVMPITPLVVVAALLLNGIAALPFGWLYRRHGLESAMFAHFTADFILYVVGPFFLIMR